MKKIILIFFFFSKVNAAVIYDYEIELFISDIIEIINPENKTDISFTLILDDTPNAFVNETNQIMLTSGLLKYVQSPEALIGVIAHEIGHIEHFHIIKKKQRIKEMRILDQVGSLAAITSTILTNNPAMLLQTSVASKSNIQNYYTRFSKDQEREADLFAIQKLNDLKISSKGLVEFLKFLEKESYKKGLSDDSFMFATHPHYNDRLNIISNFSNNNNNKLNTQINEKFYFVKAKLFGHTENDIGILENYLSGDNFEYGKSIIQSKKGKLLKALIIINKLINNKPDNTFFLETKGDMLFNHGYILEAKEFYKIALSKNNNNIHIKKRLFHISYDQLELSNIQDVRKIDKKYKNLVFNYSQDINFYHKWLNIFTIIEKKDWLLFVNAWIDILNEDMKYAIIRLEEIKKISRNSTLLVNTNKLINHINDE